MARPRKDDSLRHVLRYRCSEQEFRFVSMIAEATGNSNSDVLRQMVAIGTEHLLERWQQQSAEGQGGNDVNTDEGN